MNTTPAGKSGNVPNAICDTTKENPIMSNAETTRSITDLRRALIAESLAHFEASRSYMAVLTPSNADATQADWDAFGGAVGTGTYAWLVAGILRLLEQRHPETAVEVAKWVGLSQDSGIDWLEDLNDDIDATSDGNAPAVKAGA